MPDPANLKIGDQGRILRVPIRDLQQREREIADQIELAGWTADTSERIIDQTPIIPISHCDEQGCVWYDATIIHSDSSQEEHSLIVYDDDTWEHVSFSDR